MGDPLSIVASSIAILGALTTSGKGISKLISLRHAPEELQDLCNEVESLRLILEHIRRALLSIHGSQLYRDHEDAMTSLLQDMRRAVDDLESLIVYQLQRVESDGTTSLSKREWLQATSKIERKKQRISQARSKLGTMMDTINFQVGGQSEQRHALQIQSISLVSQDVQSLQKTMDASFAAFNDNTQSALAMQGERMVSLLDEMALSMQRRGTQSAYGTNVEQSSEAARGNTSHQEIRKTKRPSDSSLTASNPQSDESSSSAKSRASIDQTSTSTEDPPQQAISAISRSGNRGQSAASYVRIDTTMNVRACPRFCKCQCHVQTHFQTPRILRDIVGQLLFSYTGQLRASACNYPPCRQSNIKRRFMYYFPVWTAARALMISRHAHDVKGPGSDWALRIPVHIAGNNALWFAARNGNIPFLQKQFSTGMNPWIIDEFGQSLLHQAIRVREEKTARFLLEEGADPDHEDDEGVALDSMIIEYGLYSSDLLDITGSTLEDALERLAFTALHASAAQIAGHDPLSPALLEREFPDLNTRDRLGMTPLHWACCCRNTYAVELLLSWNADASAQDRRGWTCLQHAASSNDYYSVELLLDSGCDAKISDLDGRTALFSAYDARILKLLVSSGSSVNHRDQYGNTPLHSQILSSAPIEVLQILVDRGVDIAAVDDAGRDPISLAIMESRLDALKVLFDAFSQRNESPNSFRDPDSANYLHLAALFSSVEVMRALAAENLEGLDPTAKDKYGDTPTKCFYRDRNQNCTLIRPPFEEEEEAWWDLMESACRQNNINFETFEPEWWDYYRQGMQSEVETLSDGDENDFADDTADNEDSTTEPGDDEDAATTSSEHEPEVVDRQAQRRNAEQSPQQEQADEEEEEQFTDALEDQSNS